jgi:hypothetical protein
VKSWGQAVASAFWFATITAAAQVGTASILGVLRMDGDLDADTWTGRLTLLCWFAVTSVIAGAYAGSRASGSGTRLAASLAAGLGGALGASIALYPARETRLPQGDAQLLAGIALAFAAIAGFILAFGLLSARALGWNVAATSVLAWGLLALGVAGHADDIRLGQISTVDGLTLWGLPAALGVLSLITAIVARVRRHHRAAVAFSGIAGPATIALAYALAGPGDGDPQKIPWTSALVAVITGLAASLLVALPPRGTPNGADDLGTGPAFPLPADTFIADKHRPFVDLDDRDAPVARHG